MKKVLFLIVLMAVSLVTFSTSFAYDYNPATSPWGQSLDGKAPDGSGKWGYQWVQSWLDNHYDSHGNAYGSTINAQTGYESLSGAPMAFWNSGTDTFEIQAEVAGYATSNKVGYYYLLGNNQNSTIQPLNQLPLIFTGPETAGASHTLTLTQAFGLYMTTPEGKTWYTYRDFNSPYQSGVTKAPQALIYTLEPGKKWLVCWEDLNWSCGDRDFNDMYMTVKAVPEPVSSALFLIGGAGLAVARSRRKQSNA
jgi:hypothetical protein